MQSGKPVTIVLDETVTRTARPLIEMQALAGKAVALLARKKAAMKATIFRRPKSDAFRISLVDDRSNIIALYKLKRTNPCVDFEIEVNAARDYE